MKIKIYKSKGIKENHFFYKDGEVQIRVFTDNLNQVFVIYENQKVVIMSKNEFEAYLIDNHFSFFEEREV